MNESIPDWRKNGPEWRMTGARLAQNPVRASERDSETHTRRVCLNWRTGAPTNWRIREWSFTGAMTTKREDDEDGAHDQEN